MASALGPGTWRGRLAEVADALRHLLADREHEFLALGELLHGFAGEAARRTGETTSLAEQAADRELAEVIEALSAELDALEQVRGAGRIRQGLAELTRVREISEDLSGLHREFRRVVKTLKMLGISTRIESARLGSLGSGFTTLADDVERLAGHVVSHFDGIIAGAGELSRLAQAATDESQAIAAGVQRCSDTILTGFGENIAALRRLAQAAAQAAVGGAERSGHIEAELSEAVTRLQFHDIIRQQMEHVVGALDDVGALSEDEAAVREGSDFAGWLADVCELESSQLDNAALRLNEALERLRELLASIGSDVQANSRELRRVLDLDACQPGQDCGAGGGALASIRQGVAGIAAGLGDYASQSERLGQVVVEVSRTVEGLNPVVASIEDIGSQIELIALNASIKAAHTGEKGLALSVLAQAIQSLAMEARNRTGHVAELLETSEGSARELRGVAESMRAESFADRVAGLRGLTDRLAELDGSVRSAFRELAASGEDLAARINASAEAIDFHESMMAVMLAGRDALAALRQEAEQAAGDRDQGERTQRLRQLLDRYTMDAERLVHLRAMGLDDAVEPDGSCEPELFDLGDTMDDGLGDNVELF